MVLFPKNYQQIVISNSTEKGIEQIMAEASSNRPKECRFIGNSCEDFTSDDEKYMKRAYDLAVCGTGLTYPNPMVGAVIVRNNVIIGEGYHQKAGCGHAEVNAINSVKDKELLKDSTIYVTLEPCSHYGKTPPCAKLIIEMGIPNIVVGCIDTFSEVSGRGIEMLRQAGRNVKVGVLESMCRNLNKRFFTYHEKKRPYVILKWAESADGFIDRIRTASEPATRITNDYSNILVHKQRGIEQAIMVGGNTVRMDNPSLTTRLYAGSNPMRYIFSPTGNINADSKVLTDGGNTIVLKGICNPCDVMKKMYDDGIQSVIIEGGQQTLQTFIDAGIWDEAYIYHGDFSIADGIKAPKLKTIFDLKA